MLYALGLGNYNHPFPPVLILWPSLPGPFSVAFESPENTIEMLRYCGHVSTCWSIVADNADMEAHFSRLMAKAGQANFPHTRRNVSYVWRPEDWWDGERVDSVVWSGRATSTYKGPVLGAQVYSMLPKVEKHVFFPRQQTPPRMSGKDGISGRAKGFYFVPQTEIHTGLGTQEYRALAGQAKVLLTSGPYDAYPIGYIELWGMGCLPVAYRAPWVLDLLPPDWPLYYRSAAEGAEMVLEAIGNYDRYAPLLHEWMATRFTRPFNFGDIVAEIWHDYTCQLGDSIRLLQERGEWRSL
jgi:hypothetical protein